MMTSLQGIYQNGTIELTEPATNIQDGTPVIVTFLSNGCIDLSSMGITPAQADEMRQRMAAFAEDWNSQEMAIYDNYHAAKSKE